MRRKNDANPSLVAVSLPFLVIMMMESSTSSSPPSKAKRPLSSTVVVAKSPTHKNGNHNDDETLPSWRSPTSSSAAPHRRHATQDVEVWKTQANSTSPPRIVGSPRRHKPATKRSSFHSLTLYFILAIGLASLSYVYMASVTLMNTTTTIETKSNLLPPAGMVPPRSLHKAPRPVRSQTTITTTTSDNNHMINRTRTRFQRPVENANNAAAANAAVVNTVAAVRAHARMVILDTPLETTVVVHSFTKKQQHSTTGKLSVALPTSPMGMQDEEENDEFAIVVEAKADSSMPVNSTTTSTANTTSSSEVLFFSMDGNSTTTGVFNISLESSSNTNTSDDGDGTNNEDKAEFVEDEQQDSEIVQECEPAESWQQEAHPNCNSIHELNLIPTGHASSLDIQFLGQGWFRSTWRVDHHLQGQQESVVLKVLRLERDFLEEYYELHRRDAVAMDHLTFSPFVMNVHGYCGQSALNELAEFRDGINALEQLDRRLRGRQFDGILLLKLRLALSVSVGLYHVQFGIPGYPWEHTNLTSIRPTMAHYDINPRNIAIVKGGIPKLNDFNIAEFLRYPRNSTNESSCGFPSRLHEPWWRAPEEMHLDEMQMVNEKVDVYALGAVLYHILTTHSPRGKMKKERMDSVRQDVIRGIPPSLPEPLVTSQDPILRAFREAMKLCFAPNPTDRGTSGDVAIIFYQALLQVSDQVDAANAMHHTSDHKDKAAPKKEVKKKKKTVHH